MGGKAWDGFVAEMKSGSLRTLWGRGGVRGDGMRHGKDILQPANTGKMEAANLGDSGF